MTALVGSSLGQDLLAFLLFNSFPAMLFGILVESSNHALDQIFGDPNRMRFGYMHDVGNWWISFCFSRVFFCFLFCHCCVCYLLLFCVIEGLDIFDHTSFSRLLYTDTLKLT